MKINSHLFFSNIDYCEKKNWIGLVGLFMLFNNISVISWRSVLLMEETGQTYSHNVVSSIHRHERGSPPIKLTDTI